MYADDVILISETASGLQNCLNQLSKYCERWNLEINTSKSKAMIFNNRGRLKTDVLKFNSSIIENVIIRSYTYLGITLSWSVYVHS
jgi:lipid II:glycine glycyltransferase (peptidoglycan interpeptide bridge formation enzyme)